MIDPIDHIVDYPDLSEAEIEALRRAVARDAVLATLVACRREIGASVRSTVGAYDSRMLTLHSLYRAGRANDLSKIELELVEEQAHRFEQACSDHTVIRVASEDVARAASAFSKIWDAHFNAAELSRTDVAEADTFSAATLDDPRTRADANADDARTRADANADFPAPGSETALSPAHTDAEAPSDAEPHPAAPSTHRPRTARRPPPDSPAADRLDRSPSRTRRSGRVYRWMVRGAIAGALVAFAFILTQLAGRDDNRVTIETGEGQVQLVELADGSRIRVLESSSLSYIDSESMINRSADLDGRAYFEITPESRGFLVETPTARITVLGTSFGVEAGERLTEVVLTEGRLTLARSTQIDDFVVLEPGEMSRVVAGSSPSAPIAIDVPRRLTWTGLFIFQSTPLSDIASLLGEHFGVSIQVADELASERVTGTFEQSRPLDEILRIIASAVGAHVASDSEGGYALTHP